MGLDRRVDFLASASAPLVSSMHSHHATAIYIPVDGIVTVIDFERNSLQGTVVIVPPDRPHSVSCSEGLVSLLYDPEVAPEIASYARALDCASLISGRLARRFRGLVHSSRSSFSEAGILDGIGSEARSWFADLAKPRLPDTRVSRVLEALSDPGADPVEVGRMGISAPHLRALWARDVGLPIRTYALWRRFISAAGIFLVGADATTAAHEAGFADLAHFSRTCRRMLGHSPAELARNLATRYF